jgi:hypothetical protein
MEPTTHYVQFSFNPDEKEEKMKRLCKPQILYAKENELIRFIGKNTDVRIYIPEAHLLFKDSPANLLFPVKQGDERNTYTVIKRDSKLSKQEYAYAVYMENGRDFAEGNSTPKIIVE